MSEEAEREQVVMTQLFGVLAGRTEETELAPQKKAWMEIVESPHRRSCAASNKNEHVPI